VLVVEDLQEQVRTTRVALATAHRDHDPTNNRPRNLVALCQGCHLQHDREEHRRRRWLTLFQRNPLGDLFLGRYH
jgi:5-methylcytosine-specific restriction endonuclease McrA